MLNLAAFNHQSKAMQEQPIYIIGAGAVGKTLAVFLTLAGRQVYLLRGSVFNAPVTYEEMTILAADNNKYVAKLEIGCLADFTRLGGLVVLANKAFGNQALSVSLRGKLNGNPLLVLQNGLNIEQAFLKQNFEHIYRCVLMLTCQFEDPHTIRYKPVRECPVGIIRGDEETLTRLLHTIQTLQFRFSKCDEIQSLIWKKVIANCVFNSICPLLHIDNGIFYRNEVARDMAKELIISCMPLAHAKGIAINPEDVFNNVMQISQMSDGQYISTLQDILHHRPTEMDALNIELARLADEIGIGATMKEIALLGRLTKLKAAINLKNM